VSQLRRSVIGACICVLVFAPASAQAGTAAAPAPAPGLTVSPTLIDVKLAPGASEKFDVTLTAGDSSVRVEFEHVDLGYTEDTYEQQFIPDSAEQTTSFTTRGWLRPAESSFTLRAGQTRVVPLTIRVPENATPGTHLGVALFRTVPPSNESDGPRVAAAVRTGPIVTVAVIGGSKPKPKIHRFEVDSLVSSAPVPVELSMTNKGETHFFAEGTLTIEGRGRSATVGLPRRLIVPDIPRDMLPQDASRIRAGEDLPPGRYTVTVKMTSDPAALTVTQSETVWIVPMWLRVLLVIALLAAAGAAALAFRRYQERRWLRIAAEQDRNEKAAAAQPGSDDEVETVVGVGSAAPPTEDVGAQQSEPDEGQEQRGE
jgi:hypothetical protein